MKRYFLLIHKFTRTTNQTNHFGYESEKTK